MKSDSSSNFFPSAVYEGLEMSTKLLIRSAQRRNIQVKVLDRQANFICLKQKDKQGQEKIEYVKQATKTRLDSYLSFVCMEDKQISKLLLRQAGLRVPQGLCLSSLDEGLQKYDELKQLGRLVIKPATTNYGTAIHILDSPVSQADYHKALKNSFSYSERVIAEAFVAGKEYRFLIMGDECVAVCHRLPANVCADGSSTIAELIEKKNQDPRRGLGHTTPLEKLQLGPTETAHLQAINLSPHSVVEADQIVFLRANSNISTGGDSIDCTKELSAHYKETALRATKAVGACCCGVDIIIPETKSGQKNSNKQDYVVLELNFNPTIYIHECPFLGEGQAVSDKVLDLLGFK